MTTSGMLHHSLVNENEVCYSEDVKEIVTGHPGFEQIINFGDVIYVDKTEYVYRMVSGRDKFFFISRPRRFGKSLMCATLDALFSGKKELFDNLFISKTDYDFMTYPVLRFDFSMMKSDDYDGFLRMFQQVLEGLGKKYGCIVERGMPSVMLQGILEAVDNPVIIIDEFDSAIIEAVSTGNMELAEKMRSCFNSFYSVIKSYTPKIRFFFITGCTKLSGLNIFSSMNNLRDISRDAEYAAMFGYTEEELEHYFDEHIDYKVEQTKGTYTSRGEFLDALRNYYDGYRFAPDIDVRVYNPVSIGYYFSSSVPEFRNYWMQTGGASTLAVTLARKADLLSIVDTEIRVNIEKISAFDITQIAQDRIPNAVIYVLLYYAGYLTIADYNGSLSITFNFPNDEVRSSFLSLLVETYSDNGDETAIMVDTARVAARRGNVREVVGELNEYYRIFNYRDLPSKFKERAVHILFKAFFSMLGFPVFTEVPSGDGISDAVLLTPKHNYIVEFKADSESSEGAMKQIIDTHYADLFAVDKKPLHLIGIDFRTETKQIVSYTHQLYGSDDVEMITL